jgi:hypothetical protein
MFYLSDQKVLYLKSENIALQIANVVMKNVITV